MSRDSSWRHDEDKGCHLDGPNLTEIPFFNPLLLRKRSWFLCGPQAGERKREISAIGNAGGNVVIEEKQNGQAERKHRESSL